MTKKTKLLAAAALVILFLYGCSNNPEPTVSTIEDVAGSRIGAVSGTAAMSYASLYGESATYLTGETLMSDLCDGAIDCVLTDSRLTSRLLRLKRGARALPEPLLSTDYCIVSAIESRDMMTDINAVLSELKADGTLVLLEEKYILGKTVSIPASDLTGGYTASLRLAVPEDGFPPYCFFDETDTAQGFDIELARIICSRLNVGLVIIPAGQSKLIDTVRFGRADFAMGGLYQTDETSGLAEFSSSYTTVNIDVITRR